MKSFLLTIDVEDWFQVENFKECIPYSSWSSHELRVEKNTHRILDLLDKASTQRSASSGQRDEKPRESCKSSQENIRQDQQELSGRSCRPCLGGHAPTNNGQRTTKDGPNQIRATFFVLGWVAERVPALVREIHARGHEIASHGHSHELCTKCTPGELKRDLLCSKRLLEDIIGDPVYGYRAPSFSVDDDSLKIVRDCGFMYDSSYNSFAMHGRYGKVALNRDCAGRKTIGHQISHDFFELPISNLNVGGRIFPWGGGGYFRLIPLVLFELGIRRILKSDGAYLFYMHPWEIDPEQPRVEVAKWMYRLRHYINLEKTYSRLSRIVTDFVDNRFVTCKEYLTCVAET